MMALQYTLEDGITVRELKQILNELIDEDEHGHERTVWIGVDKHHNEQVKNVVLMNIRKNNGKLSADIVLEYNRGE